MFSVVIELHVESLLSPRSDLNQVEKEGKGDGEGRVDCSYLYKFLPV